MEGKGPFMKQEPFRRGSIMADEEKKTYKFVCTVCGVGPDMFERVED